MTVKDLLDFCSKNSIDVDKAHLVIADKPTEDDFTAVQFSVWNGQQLILYKEDLV